MMATFAVTYLNLRGCVDVILMDCASEEAAWECFTHAYPNMKVLEIERCM